MDKGWGSFEMRDVKQGDGVLCLQVLNIQSILVYLDILGNHGNNLTTEENFLGKEQVHFYIAVLCIIIHLPHYTT